MPTSSPRRRRLHHLTAVAAALSVTTAGATFVPAATAHAIPPAHSRTTAAAAASGGTSADETGDVIYELMTDRFYDGDTGNDDPASSSGLYDGSHQNWQLYWGGDFAGVTAKMQYLKDLGIGAIWISPPVQNVNVPVGSGSAKSSGYHGYWGMDYYVPEPHFGDWSAFDAMVSAAHAQGIKVVMDWAPNHTSPEDTNDPGYAADGALKKNGVTQSEYDNDPQGWFHHNGGVQDYQDPYQAEYKNLFNLADLAQENPSVTNYLQGAVDTWLGHGVDGIRMDAVKHMPGGWLKGYVDHIDSTRSVFTFGEWADPSSAPMWPDEVKFANTDGMSLENIDLNAAERSAFSGSGSMKDIDAALTRQQSQFAHPNQLVNLVDDQDESRLLSVYDNTTRLDQAEVVNLTVPGIPSVYYGDEQYLHNDTTNGSGQVGGDPYNRPMMTSFSESTRGFTIIHDLSALRRANPALRFGASGQRWMNDDVYVYERTFAGNVVLVAVNKSTTNSYALSGLQTALPAGQYADSLGGALGGGTLTVGSGTGGSNPAGPYTLQPGQAAVWSYVAPTTSTPTAGTTTPTMGHAGDAITVAGTGFGDTTGTATVGGVAATVQSWSPTEVQLSVPAGAPAGDDKVVLTSATGHVGSGVTYHVESGPQVPVTFTVTGTSTSPGDEIYLTGNDDELGNWSTDTSKAIGPLLDPAYPSWFSMASVPGGATVQYKFFIKKADGSIVWEGGSNHSYTAPTSGTGSTTVAWQN
ncbi:MAG TPA: alpha-amylase family glycosyl hydrolase [Flexivirga sp.]|uniref:alpha-amylase family glycosyl hydrolase n=1 Tax=Flexivirga sp. TaxID=1962927 RepID=UPI002C8F8FE5|nr:alpha-amylase family glycosyl hydrolase [Flexivirga sp.]HWC21450.1 alpha-amylase family glycosyl hydrolase [Flexivirga sp.]